MYILTQWIIELQKKEVYAFRLFFRLIQIFFHFVIQLPISLVCKFVYHIFHIDEYLSHRSEV